MSDSDRDALVRRLRKALEGIPELGLARLFGSAAEGRLTPDSDVDVAIALDRPLDLDLQIELSQRLAAAVGREVDLIDLRSASGTLLDRALTTGEMLICRDRPLYASLLQRLWYEEADWMPLYRRILEARRERFLRE